MLIHFMLNNFMHISFMHKINKCNAFFIIMIVQCDAFLCYAKSVVRIHVMRNKGGPAVNT